jgi:hsdR-like type I restriction modification system protein
MDFHFNKWLLAREKGVEEDRALQELHQAYTFLSQEDQKYADVFISDIQSGSIDVEPGKSFRDYVTEYRQNAENQQLDQFCNRYGIDKKILVQILNSRSSQFDINEFGRYESLVQSADLERTKLYYKNKFGKELKTYEVNFQLDEDLRAFIKDGYLN